MLEVLAQELEKLLGIEVVLEPSPAVLKKPHIRILPELMEREKQGGHVILQDNITLTVTDDQGNQVQVPGARVGIPYKVSVPIKLAFRSFGANVKGSFLAQALKYSFRLSRVLEREIKVPLGELTPEEGVLVRGDAVAVFKREGTGKFYNVAENEEREAEMFMYEEVWQGNFYFLAYDVYEVPKVQQVTATNRSTGSQVIVP